MKNLKLVMSQTLFKICVLSALLGAVLGLFSYCAPSFRPIGGYIGDLASEEEESSDDEDSDDSASENEDSDDDEGNRGSSSDTKDTKKETPYEISMDTFAFMGCNFHNTKGDVFHIKAGAFNDDKNLGGIRARRVVQNKTVQDIVRDYPYADSRPLLFIDTSPVETYSNFGGGRGIPLKNELSRLLDSGRSLFTDLTAITFQLLCFTKQIM